ncbi:(2Fe-2S)-binding protein [Duganella callida]|uniref:(2Fe-2S)-binding protein n=1 Tax=Duganella callida TaxID=2561932 RepID=A0A4Y9SU13_9BURK|nr:(2Fe-2S)-binding protein [Duganella callida]
MKTYTITVNSRQHTVRAEPDTPLLYILRDELQLNGAKFGCGLGQCGACTVIVDGAAVMSCLLPVAALGGRAVRTVEGLGSAQQPGPLQQAFIDEQAAQCGYCIAGMIMRAQALLDRNPHPGDAEIRQHMALNLCRCGTHMRILRAIHRAANHTSKPAPATNARTAGADGAHQASARTDNGADETPARGEAVTAKLAAATGGRQ